MTLSPHSGTPTAAEIEDALITVALPNLEAEFTDNPVDFMIPLGDNWLAAWNWAEALERDKGIDHQRALRLVHTRYFAEANA